MSRTPYCLACKVIVCVWSCKLSWTHPQYHYALSRNIEGNRQYASLYHRRMLNASVLKAPNTV